MNKNTKRLYLSTLLIATLLISSCSSSGSNESSSQATKDRSQICEEVLSRFYYSPEFSTAKEWQDSDFKTQEGREFIANVIALNLTLASQSLTESRNDIDQSFVEDLQMLNQEVQQVLESNTYPKSLFEAFDTFRDNSCRTIQSTQPPQQNIKSNAYLTGYEGNIGSIRAYVEMANSRREYCASLTGLHPEFDGSDIEDYIQGCLDVLKDTFGPE